MMVATTAPVPSCMMSERARKPAATAALEQPMHRSPSGPILKPAGWHSSTGYEATSRPRRSIAAISPLAFMLSTSVTGK